MELKKHSHIRQLVVPRSLTQVAVKSLHNGPGGGHLGLTKIGPKFKTDSNGLRRQIKLRSGAGNAARNSPSITPVHP